MYDHENGATIATFIPWDCRGSLRTHSGLLPRGRMDLARQVSSWLSFRRERERAAQQTAAALPTTPGRVRRRQRKLELPLAPRESEPAGGSSREPEQSDPEATEAFSEMEARRLDSHQAWLRSAAVTVGPARIVAHTAQTGSPRCPSTVGLAQARAAQGASPTASLFAGWAKGHPERAELIVQGMPWPGVST